MLRSDALFETAMHRVECQVVSAVGLGACAHKHVCFVCFLPVLCCAVL